VNYSWASSHVGWLNGE